MDDLVISKQRKAILFFINYCFKNLIIIGQDLYPLVNYVQSKHFWLKNPSCSVGCMSGYYFAGNKLYCATIEAALQRKSMPANNAFTLLANY
jgi:hypothetical protein